MPSIPHEAPLAVLREDPALVPTLLRDALGIDVPAYEQVELSDADFTQAVPAEFRADLVLVLRGPGPAREPVMGLVVEVQRGRDERKRTTWPLYLAALHARLECPTCLVVVTTEVAIARWAAEPITTLHPGTVLAPIVLGPAQVPWVSPAEAQARPWLAVLSTLVHGNRPGGGDVARAAVDALATLPEVHATVGYDLILASLDLVGRQLLEAHMETRKYKYEYQSDFARKYYGEGVEAGRKEGREEGRVLAARHMLSELAARRIGALGEARQARIEACGDVERLERAVLRLSDSPDPAEAEQIVDDL